MADKILEALKPNTFSKREMNLDLTPREFKAKQLGIQFLTPTDIRSEVAEFATVFSRARDRVSTLRALYGEGPLPVNHRALGQCSAGVTLLHSDLRWHDIARRSAATAQVHTLSGFTGAATYEGNFSPFYAILQAAQFTGIGRKTVWGNGQISVE